MNFLKKNYNAFASLKNSFLNSLVINEHDKKEIHVNNFLFNDELDFLKRYGHVEFKNILPENINKIIKQVHLQKKIFSPPILEFFSYFYNEYFSLVKNYLGDDACLVLIGLNEQKKDQKSFSGNWHTDNWGRSLNVFVSIKSNGLIPTVYVEGSHKKKYFADYNEYLRLIGRNNNVEKKRSVLIKHNTNDISFFDGNGLHRGMYEKDSFRLTLNMTFVSFEKICALGLKKVPNFFCFKNTKPKIRKQIDSSMLLFDGLKSTDLQKYSFFKKELFILNNNEEYFSI